jgi:hypothetical protein
MMRMLHEIEVLDELPARRQALLTFICANRNSYWVAIKQSQTIMSWLPDGEKPIQQKLYNFCYDTQTPICRCGHPLHLKDRSFFRGYVGFCSQKCSNNSRETQNKRRDTCVIKFGAGSPRGSDVGKARYAATWQRNHEKNLASVAQAKKARAATCMDRYGVDCVLKHPPIWLDAQKRANACRHAYRTFVSSSGKIYKIRGYENFAIEILEQSGIEFIADDSQTPHIKYVLNARMSTYYPDIFIPSANKIIEVKSEYWLRRQSDKNLAIMATVLDSRRQMEFWIFGPKGKTLKRLNTLSALKEALK